VKGVIVMCVALPGKVQKVFGQKALVDFNGNQVEARTGLVDVKTGDYVLVHAGCILQKMNEIEAEQMTELFSQLEAFR
jgi:hydrogenase expression/formation protein HypC